MASRPTIVHTAKTAPPVSPATAKRLAAAFQKFNAKAAAKLRGPCVVNKFDTEAEAVSHAKHWSGDQHFWGEWSVIHAPSDAGCTAFFVEKGDGGMIVTMTERLVGTYKHGRKIA